MPFAMSDKFVTESLFEKMKQFIKKDDKILLPGSKISRTYLYDNLRDAGCLVDKVDIYDTVEGDILDIKATEKSMKDVDVILFTSPSTVRNLIKMVGIENIKDKTIISIGEITLREIHKQGLESFVSDEATVHSLVEKIIEIKEHVKCLKDIED